jgi:hypothetical protein
MARLIGAGICPPRLFAIVCNVLLRTNHLTNAAIFQFHDYTPAFLLRAASGCAGTCAACPTDTRRLGLLLASTLQRVQELSPPLTSKP